MNRLEDVVEFTQSETLSHFTLLILNQPIYFLRNDLLVFNC